MSDNFRYVLIAALLAVLGGSLGALYIGADKDTWKIVAPSSVTGVFALLQGKNDDPRKPSSPA